MKLTTPKEFEFTVEEVLSLIESEIKKENKLNVRENGFIHVFIDSSFKSKETMDEVEKVYRQQGWNDVKISKSSDSPKYSIYLNN